MIVVDIETSGLYPEKCGIWQIGAIDVETKKEFLEEARIDDEDIVTNAVLPLTGMTEKELRDPIKQTQKNMLNNFFEWTKNSKIKNAVCENPQFDLAFLTFKARKYNLEFPLHYRAFDLHSIAALRYYQIHGKFLIEQGHSAIGLTKILEFCGMQDERIQIKEGRVIKKGKPHNALEDAKLEAECFSRLIYGKSLLLEYFKFKIPEYLIQEK